MNKYRLVEFYKWLEDGNAYKSCGYWSTQDAGYNNVLTYKELKKYFILNFGL